MLDDFKTAVAFLTRLPMPHPQGPMPQNFVRAHRMFPLVGAMIGAAVGRFASDRGTPAYPISPRRRLRLAAARC